MKVAAFLLAALVLAASIPILVRCNETLANENFNLDNNNAGDNYVFDLKTGDTISISVVANQGQVVFEVTNTMGRTYVNQADIGTGGWHGQWAVPTDDTYNLGVWLESGSDTASGTMTLTSSGTGNTQQDGRGGEFDSAPIVVAVILLLIWFISVPLLVRRREQSPPPPPQT